MVLQLQRFPCDLNRSSRFPFTGPFLSVLYLACFLSDFQLKKKHYVALVLLFPVAPILLLIFASFCSIFIFFVISGHWTSFGMGRYRFLIKVAALKISLDSAWFPLKSRKKLSYLLRFLICDVFLCDVTGP